jgi:hypothetical protein
MNENGIPWQASLEFATGCGIFRFLKALDSVERVFRIVDMQRILIFLSAFKGGFAKNLK